MDYHLSIAVILMLLYVASQLGSKLSARHALIWLIISCFVIWSVLFPTSLRSISTFFGVQLVSNFVLASLIFFLFIQTISLHAEINASNSKTRQLVSSLASKEFLAKNSKLTSAKNKQVLIIVPCYNEEASIHATLDRLDQFLAQSNNGDWTYDYCVIDDGSQDKTEDILQQRAPANYVRHSINQGVSGALLTGFFIAERIGVDFVVQCDADGQHPIELINYLVQQAFTEKADLMIGSRFAPGHTNFSTPEYSSLESTTYLRRFGGVLITFLLRLFGSRNQITDPTSGFRCYSAKSFSTLKRAMPEEYPEPESIAILGLQHCVIKETQVRMNKREQGVSSISGLKSIKFMLKVSSALFGLRLRTLMGRKA